MLKQLTSCKQSKRTLCQTEGRTGNLYSPGRQIYRNDVRVRHSAYVTTAIHRSTYLVRTTVYSEISDERSQKDHDEFPHTD